MTGFALWLLLGSPSAHAEDPDAIEPAPERVVDTVGPDEPTPEGVGGGGKAEPSPGTGSGAETRTWLGVLSVLGSRKIPLLGKVEFQTDTFVLARATPTDGGDWEVEQATCRVAFPKTMGAQIRLDPKAFQKIPQSTLTWTIDEDGTWTAGPWESGWSAEDHDDDGNPGITLEVKAPFCGGDLYASSEADQTASGRPDGTHVVTGDISVHVIQKTLGTRGPCLGLMARDSDEVMDGRFAFVEAPEGTTCHSDRTWPRIDW